MTLPDAQARREAVDPLVSCCVSAPAGSGKTELLIQRYLALLARVDEPERVIAITFTRKAAAEMRARLLGALGAARANPVPATAHERLTRDLALAALANDRERGWGLVASPSRLRIQTIDSLCGELTRQMPVLSGCGGDLAVSDDASHLYREAVESFLRGEDSKPGSRLRRLLLHLDNNWQEAATLLQALLARRDQWQRLLGVQALGNDHRDRLETVVAALVAGVLDALRGLLAGNLNALRQMLAYRQQQLGSAVAFDADSRDLRSWRTLADALLTAKGEWRRALRVQDGFPSGSPEEKQQKKAMLALIAELQASDGRGELLAALCLLRILPEPAADERHWQVLRSLVDLLPRLSAQLLLVFRQHGEVDHAQRSLGALAALGDDDAPTDLALRLDNRIEHFLVDEFQDTSSGQFELLTRLTRGWAEHNAADPQAPRTVMVVGDPMQSIYGFRAANVGLFIRARDTGIGDLRLRGLTLTANFRSRAAIVNWVNEHFQRAFPHADDPQLGAVRYRPSDPTREGGAGPELHTFSKDHGRAAEVAWLCDQLQAGLAREDVRSIAVLGRSRNALAPLLAAMRQRGIGFVGRDLDALAQRMVVRDLLTLCEVLQNHHDAYAWLCLLRGPWVALDHADLLAVSREAPTASTVLAADELSPALVDCLSTAGAERLRALLRVLRWAEHYRDRLALRVWVEELWLRLGGAAAHPQLDAHSDAEQFLQALEALEQAGQGLQLDLLRERVESLFAAPGDDSSRVEVMTLHRAKGLEFDWVFIPALERGVGTQPSELLLWDEVLPPGGDPAFLLDIRSARDVGDRQRLYDYLKYRHREKRRLEDARLLYVGCTRAVSRLVLTTSLEPAADGDLAKPPADSLLAFLTPALEVGTLHAGAGLAPAAAAPAYPYRRLQQPPEAGATPPAAAAVPVDLASNRLPRALGTAVHQCAEALLYRDSLPDSTDPPLRDLLRSGLAEAGCEPGMLDVLLQQGRACLDALLRDPWARWMLDPGRPERAAELPVTLLDDGEARHLVLDYVFVDEASGERWVVDYKTSAPAGDESLPDFIAAQCERYAEQLGVYRQAMTRLHGEPVRCALYFLALGQHAEVPAPPGDGAGDAP